MRVFSILIAFLLLSPMAAAYATQDADVNVEMNTKNSSTFNFAPHTESRKPYPFPGEVRYGPLTPLFSGKGSSTHHNITKLKNIIELKPEWSASETKTNLVEENGLVISWKSLVPEPLRWSTRRISYMEKGNCYTVLGFVKVWSKKDATTMEILDVALRYAMLMGGNRFLVIEYNVDESVEASGWGIGGNRTIASDHTITTGGTGYSSAKSGNIVKPFIHIAVLYVNGKEAKR